MNPLKIFLLLLLVVAVICINDRSSHNSGVAFYGQDWDDSSADSGWEEEDEEENSGDDDYSEEEDDDEKYDKSWKEDEDEDCDDCNEKKGDSDNYDHRYHAHHHHYHHNIPPPRKPMISITTRPPHRGNYNDGYGNGFNAGLLDPENRNHTIEYIRTVTDCGINKRVDVIDGVSYTFSTMTTIGPNGVTRTEADFDGSTILLPYTGADRLKSTIPFGGATRTIVQVEDEATTLPIHVRPTPQPFNNHMLEEVFPLAIELDQVAGNNGLAAVGISNGDERRMALDAMHYGKSQALAVGDDGISGTVLRHIKFDRDGNPIIPSNAGTRPVYVINGRTTTLRNGIPLSFPVDNGHTRTVVALRSGVVTLPLSGGDDITKLLSIDGLTETVVVFDEMTYTLSPDDTSSGSHPPHSVPSKIMRTVVVEEILNTVPPPSPSSAVPSAVPSADAATLSGVIGAGAISQMLYPNEIGKDPRSLFKLPLKTIVLSQSVDVSVISRATSSTSRSKYSSSPTPSSYSLAAAAVATSNQSPPQSHCSTRWILENARKSEGCYLLSSVMVVDSDMRDVDRQGYWTTNQCHSFCSNSTQILQLPSFASWYYGLTMSAVEKGNAVSSTCRCLADLSGAQLSDIHNCRKITLSPPSKPGQDKPKKQHLGLFYSDDSAALSTIYVYQAIYRCLSPSLMKRTVSPPIDPPDTWRCHHNALESHKRKSEGCYPYLTPKVTARKTRSNVVGTGWYWTAARCYSFCLDSGRVPTRGKWFYGITVTDPGSALVKNSCLCMLEMDAPPTATECQDLSKHQSSVAATAVTAFNETDQDLTTNVGIVNTSDLNTAAIYAYEVGYTCSSLCNNTNTNTTTAFEISDAKATEGCYPLSNYADRAVKKVSRVLTRDGDGIFMPDECFRICEDSGLMVPGQPWWYGVSMSDPADVRKGSIATSSCRCSIKAPSLSRYDFLAGRCNHHDVGLVDSRFLYRINNGVYVYKVSYQCPLDKNAK